MTSEYPQDDGSVYCCYDYCIEAQLQICVLHCVFCVIGCVMSGTCHVEREYPQDNGQGKKADGLYWHHWQLEIVHAIDCIYNSQTKISLFYTGDAIKQNESEVVQIWFSFFWLIVYIICKAAFYNRSKRNWQAGCKDTDSWRVAKQ